MSSNNGKIILRLRVGCSELQLEGSRQNILEMIEKDLPKIFEAISKVEVFKGKEEYHKPLTQQEESFSTSYGLAESYPQISAKSCSEAILQLLSTPWGKKKPRTLSEIKEVLDANALHYSNKVVGFTLTRLTKKQKVRRWKTEHGYVYTLTSSGAEEGLREVTSDA
ncbi:hypothetical protein DRO51_04695 [Candidatus Bathyarchaeota archaeon]|nr:MAG: hypothetical protein DRO51_04695 [Candidatus Bathyarchaeota archaeon]